MTVAARFGTDKRRLTFLLLDRIKKPQFLAVSFYSTVSQRGLVRIIHAAIETPCARPA
jgi:hypothetical protein